MKKPWPILLIAAALGCSSSPSEDSAPAASEPGPSASRSQPNILLISIDTLRADRLSSYGYTGNSTPQIDWLATQGILFEQAFTPVPITLPAHASLLTGTLPIYHGVRENSGFVLPAERTTLAESLREQGYRTGAFVGAFVLDSRFGLAQGFDHYDDAFQERSNDQQVIQLEMSERPAGEVLMAARRWIESGSSQPFLAWIHLFDPHAPYAPPGDEAVEGYDGEVSYVDRSLGRLFEFLRARRLFDSSLIVLTSDHGEGLGEHGEDTHGMFLYDSTLRVPLIIKLPDQAHAGMRIGEQVRLIDVMPTILQLSDGRVPQDVQGTSLQRAWTGDPLPELPLYAETLLPLLDYGWSDLSALRTGRHKWIEAPRPELYDLSSDPGERRNRYASDQALANQLQAQRKEMAERWRSLQGGPAWQRLDAEAVARLRSLGYAALSTPIQPGTDPLQQWRARYPAPLADPKDKIWLFNQLWEAQHESRQGRYQQSFRLLEGVLREDPGIYMAHSIQSLNLLQMGQPQEALTHLRRCVELRPEDQAAHLYRGMAAFQLGKLDEAVQAFEIVLQMDPSNKPALNNLAAAYGRQQRYDKAAEILQAILEDDPRDVAAALNLGTAYMLQGKDDLAQQSFQQALKINPRIPELYNNLGMLALKKEDYAEAVGQFRRAISLNPRYANAHRNIARAYQLQGNEEEAGKHLELARQLEAQK